jgi:hypothetical protein
VSIPTTSGIGDGVVTTLASGDLRPYNVQLQFVSATPGATVKIEILGAANFWFVEVAALAIDNNPVWVPQDPVLNIRYTFSATEVLGVPDNRTGVALELR